MPYTDHAIMIHRVDHHSHQYLHYHRGRMFISTPAPLTIIKPSSDIGRPLSITFRDVCIVCLALFLAIGLTSCKSTSGEINMISLANTSLRISPNFQTVLYKKQENGAVIIILSDLSRSDLSGGNFSGGTVLVIHMFLRPKAGSTPIEGTATNATFRDVIFPDDKIVGIYGGGGFLYPTSKISSDSWSGEIFDATLELVRSSKGFADRMRVLKMTGTIDASRDDEEISLIAYQLNTEVSKRLGSVYFVVSD